MTAGEWVGVLGASGSSIVFMGGLLVYLTRRDSAITQSTQIGTRLAQAIDSLAEKLPTFLVEKKHTEICLAQEERFGDMVEGAVAGVTEKIDSFRREQDMARSEIRERLDKMDSLRESHRETTEGQIRQMVASLGKIEGIMAVMQEKVSFR